jgi:transcription initiation factor TFIIIB Brf1 subunit/transcription initiation factor TFIIB
MSKHKLDLFKDFKNICNNLRASSATAVKSPEKIEENREIAETYCSYCNENTMKEDEGVMVCMLCSREGDRIISTQQEWNNYADSNKGDPSRCGMPSHPLLPQSSLATVVQGYRNRGYCKLQLQNSMPSNEKSLLDAITLIKNAALQLSIPATLADKASYLYSELSKGLVMKRGHVRRALMANCQYAVLKDKDSNYYICTEKLVTGYNIDMVKYNEGTKLFNQLSHYKQTGRNSDIEWDQSISEQRKTFVEPINPENITEDVCKKFGFTDQEIAEVNYIVRQVLKLKLLSSKMPSSIASGCIILYIKEKKKKIDIKKISNYCYVSETTSKSIYTSIKKMAPLLFPKNQNDLVNSDVGNCMPQIQLEKVYTAPVRAFPTAIILKNDNDTVELRRGRHSASNKKNKQSE